MRGFKKKDLKMLSVGGGCRCFIFFSRFAPSKKILGLVVALTFSGLWAAGVQALGAGDNFAAWFDFYGASEEAKPRFSGKFPEVLTDEQIRRCSLANTRARGGDCVLEILGKKYSPRYLYLSYFIKLLGRRVCLEGVIQDENLRSGTATYLVYPLTDSKGVRLSKEASKKQGVNLRLKEVN